MHEPDDPTLAQRVPEILSRDEVALLIASPPNPKHRLLLSTIYSAGLRVSEALRLRVSDVDRSRMTLRIEQGKGRKDRVVPLARRLREQIDAFWREQPPQQEWLFVNRHGSRAIDVTVAQKVFLLAKLRTGIRKRGGIHSLRHAFAPITSNPELTYPRCSACSDTAASPPRCAISTSVRADWPRFIHRSISSTTRARLCLLLRPARTAGSGVVDSSSPISSETSATGSVPGEP